MRRTSPARSGFTLVEMVVITPLVILLVGALVGVIIFVTSSALAAQARSQLQLDVLSALDRVEQDFKISTDVVSVGVNANKNLAMTSLATNKNPMDSSRRLIDSSTCSVATDGIPADLAYTYRTNYSVQNGNYIRQVSLSGACASSANVWQVATTEALIADANVSVNISYLSVGSSSKNVINIKITAAKKIAGRDIEYTGAMHVRSLNIN